MSFLDRLRDAGFNKYFLSSLTDTAVNFGQKTGEFLGNELGMNKYFLPELRDVAQKTGKSLGMQPAADILTGIIAPYALQPEELQYVDELQRNPQGFKGNVKEYGRIFAALANLYLMGRMGGPGKITNSETLKGLSRITPDLIQAVRLKQAGRVSKALEAGGNILKGSAVGAGFMGSQAFQEDKNIPEAMKQGAIFGGVLGAGAEGLGAGIGAVVEKVALKKAINSIVHRGTEFTEESLNKLHPIWKFKANWIPIDKIKAQIDPSELDRSRVEKYKEDIWSGKKVEPIIALKDGSKIEVLDGDHRLQALKETGQTQVPVFEGRINPQAGFIGNAGKPELPKPEFGKPQNKNEAEIMRDEFLAQKSAKENQGITAGQTAMFDKNQVTPEGGQMDLLSKSEADTHLDALRNEAKIETINGKKYRPLVDGEKVQKGDLVNNYMKGSKYEPSEKALGKNVYGDEVEGGHIGKLANNPNSTFFAMREVKPTQSLSPNKKEIPFRQDVSPDDAWAMDYADDYTKLGDNIDELNKQLKTAKGADKADIELKIKDLNAQQVNLEEDFMNKYKPIEDQRIVAEKTAQVEKMIESMSPEEQRYAANLIDELENMEQMRRQYPDDEQMLQNIKERTSEIQADLNQIGKKSSFKAMPERDIARVMFGDEASKNIMQARDGELYQAIRNTGLDPMQASDEEMVKALNDQGYSFDDASEMLDVFKLEHEGLLSDISPEEQSAVKVNEWLNDEVFGKMSKEEQFMAVTGKSEEQFMREEGVDKNALARAVKKLGGIKTEASIAEEISSNVPMNLRNNKTGLTPDDIAPMLRNEGYFFEDGNDLMQALWELPGQKGSGKGTRAAKQVISNFGSGNVVKAFDSINKMPRGSTGVAGIAKGQQNIFDDLASDYISANDLRRMAAYRRRVPILRAGDIPENQMEFLKVARKADISPAIKQALKDDIADTGKIRSGTWQALKDELYGKKMITTDQAFVEEMIPFKRVMAEIERSGLPVDDTMVRTHEQFVAERIMSTARGHTEAVLARLEKAGIRKDIIDDLRVMNRYPLSKIVKIKREANGVQSAAITQGYLDHLKENFKDDKALIVHYDKNIFQKTKTKTARFIEGFEIPQLYFKRIGLPELYQKIRGSDITGGGERGAVKTSEKWLLQVQEAIKKDLTAKEREQISLFYASKQGKSEDIVKAGFKIPKWSDLNKKQQIAYAKFDALRKQIEPLIAEEAKRRGVDFKPMEAWYGPLYKKRGINIRGGKVEKLAPEDDFIRKDPFFGSMHERKENVPFEVYELDMWKNVHKYINDAARFIEVGKVSRPLKYLIDSKEFLDIVGAEHQSAIRDWLKNVVEGDIKILDPLEEVIKAGRGAGATAVMGLNPKTILKQGLQTIDLAIIEGKLPFISSGTAKTLGRGGLSSIKERLPDIAVADMSDKAKGVFLGAITIVDRFWAGGTLGPLIDKELAILRKNGEKLNTKSLDKAVTAASDKLDLMMGGVTPAQRARLYRSEQGKFALQLTSTINSNFQYKISRTNPDIPGHIAAKLAKISTAIFLTAYAEVSITKASLNWNDTLTMVKDVAKGAAGNIPLVGAALFAIDSNNYDMSPVLSNINDALSKTNSWAKGNTDFLTALATWAELGGLPKQIRKSIEGGMEYGDLRHIYGGKNIDYSERKTKKSSLPDLPSTSSFGSKGLPPL